MHAYPLYLHMLYSEITNNKIKKTYTFSLKGPSSVIFAFRFWAIWWIRLFNIKANNQLFQFLIFKDENILFYNLHGYYITFS